jgi:hypothetical protein
MAAEQALVQQGRVPGGESVEVGPVWRRHILAGCSAEMICVDMMGDEFHPGP